MHPFVKATWKISFSRCIPIFSQKIAKLFIGRAKAGLIGLPLYSDPPPSGKASGKGGLVHILDEWLEDKEDKSVEFLKSSCEEINN